MFKNLIIKLLPRKESWAEKHHQLVITIGVLLFMALSLWIGLRQSVWFDEAYSITIAKLPLGDLLHMTALDTHPPLYYIVLQGWAFLFGWSELALRSINVIAAGGAVAVGVLLVRRVFGVRTALITLPFVILAPFLLRFGFEIRMYALASLICISATYVLVVALEKQNRKQKWLLYGGYAALVALGVYTLYYTALVWIAHVVWLVWLTRQEKRSLVKAPWLIAFAGSVVLFLPWLPTFVSQVGNGALAPVAQALTVENLVGIVSFQFLYQPIWRLNAVWSLVFVVLVVALIILSVRACRYIQKSEKKYVVLLLTYFLVPVTVLTFVSLARPMYIERYLSHVALGLVLLVGVIVSFAVRDGKRVTKLLSGVVLVVLAAGVVQLIQSGNYNFQRLEYPQVRDIARTITCGSGQVVLAADPYVAIELSYYLPSTCDLRFYSETASLSGGYAPLSNSPQRVSDPSIELQDVRSITYVYYGDAALSVPGTSRQVTSFGPLHAVQFSAE